MKPRSTTASVARWASVVAASIGIFAAGAAISSRMVVDEVSSLPVEKAELKRPSYLSALPERTARQVDAGIVASAVDVPTPAAETVAEPTLKVSAAPAAAAEMPSVAAAETPDVAMAAEVPTSPAPEPQSATHFVTANGLNVRTSPSGSGGKLFVLLQGEEVRVDGTDGNWAHVTAASGQSGWAYAKYLAPSS